MKLGRRLLVSLGGVAAFAMLLAMLLQDRSLMQDLESAARRRLERSARSAEALVENHLASAVQRYEAIAGTPVFRANLEVDDPPTLAHYAESLRSREGATAILFYGSRGRLAASAGSVEPTLQATLEPTIVMHEARPHLVVSVAVGRGEETLGRLVAVEPLQSATLQQWSSLCGADIVFGTGVGDDREVLSATVRDVSGVPMRVEYALFAERMAQARSRLSLLVAGMVGLVMALVASFFLARAIVKPIVRLKRVAERIGRGEFSVRVTNERADEIGDVSTAINEMAEYLEGHARALEARNAELMLARDEAQAANRAKSDFLANMSHEIRTPMNAILGYLDLLQESDLSPMDRSEWARIVRRNGEHLLSLINGILDVSRVESGTLTSVRRQFDLAACVRDVLTALSDSRDAPQVELQTEIADDCPETIESDPNQLHQILLNLIGNALKFSGGSPVLLRIACDDDDSPEQRRIRFDVIDQGIGIATDDLERIFEPFTQVDNSSTRKYGGTGLGLTISRHLTRALGGDLRAESALGSGSVFSLSIDAGATRAPRAASPSDEQPRPAAPGAETLCGRVLVAEDSLDNQRLLRALLKRTGLEVEMVENGQIALDRALAERDAGRPFDLILMDMQMPVLDGYEATGRLRRMGYEGPIVALTAHAMASDEQKCLDAGCDGYQTKPIARAALMEVLRRYCASRGHAD